VTPPTTLVLWDVDQTLVDYRGLGRAWYAEALVTVLGIDLVHVPAFPGRTERGITVELLEAHGIAWTEEHVRRVHAELVSIAEAGRATMAERGRALPGAAAVLAALAGRPEVVQTLVTGNLPELAACKLAPLLPHHHLDLEVGGYGALSADRHVLVAAARAAAEAKYGTRFAADRVVVVGDTTHDVVGARQHGVVAVGVATGRDSAAELAAAGADVVLADLSDTGAVVAALLGWAGSPAGTRDGQLPSGA